MFLAVVNKGDLCLKVLSAALVSKLSYMSACLASLALVPCLDDLGALAECAKATLAGNECGILVCEETPDEGCATVWILRLDTYAMEGLCIVPCHAPVADACTRRKDEFVFGVTVGKLVVGKVLFTIRGVVIDVVSINVFPVIAGLLLWVGRRKVVIIRDFELVVLGIVGDLAMALVDHVFADGVEGVELPAFTVAVYADVADGDLFCEVVDEAGDVDEEIGVGDEKGVGRGHVGEVILEGGGRGCAKEAGGGRGRLLLGGCGLGRARWGVDVLPVPFRV